MAGLRDDAAVVEVPEGATLVVSVDSVVDGVHFDLGLCSPLDVGWKALMGALSDLAAMGAQPLGALVALCVPPATGRGDLTLGITAGVAEAADAFGNECACTLADVLLRRVPVALGACWSSSCSREAATRVGAVMEWNDERIASEWEEFERERESFLQKASRASATVEAKA